ncbi:MAG TPA: hypothetical protein VGL90_02940, partial [Casimicrobiaceae bacterium]
MITGFSLPLAALSGVAFDACASAACGAGAEGIEERVGAAESDEGVPCVAAFGASGTRVSYRDVRAAASDVAGDGADSAADGAASCGLAGAALGSFRRLTNLPSSTGGIFTETSS